MRRLATASTLLLLGAFGALLTGCPVWGGEMGPRPGGDGGTGDGAVQPHPCSSNDQCAANQYCNVGTHECVTTPTCSNGAGCPGGYYCDNRNACVPGCSSNTDCTSLAAGLTCNATTHQCIPGGGCMTDRDCMSNEACVAGTCRGTSTLCQFNYQCNPGDECVDGRCLATCRQGATDGGVGACPSGLVCSTDGHCVEPAPTGGGTCSNCAAGQVCSNGACVSACTADSQCNTGDFCDNGVCRLDDRRPPPFCVMDSQCAAGSVCRNGVCRAACPTGTNDECLRRDVNFNVCGADHLCTSSNEQNPQCQRNSQCAAGQTCVNAICR
jgi:Cys-rich repeat protein